MRALGWALVPAPFSNEFRDFVRDNIVSVEQIAVLLLMSADPDRVWSAQELSRELSSSPASVLQRVAVLALRKLVTGNERHGFQYRADPKRDALVEELRREFMLRPVSVIALIFSGSTTLESFSNAFRIWGDNDADR